MRILSQLQATVGVRARAIGLLLLFTVVIFFVGGAADSSSVMAKTAEMPSRLPAAQLPPLEPWQIVEGPQHWAILKCKFADVGSEPQSDTFYEEMFNRADGPDIDEYWREVSYNHISGITAESHGWFTLPKTRAEYSFDSGSSSYDGLTIMQHCLYAADHAVDFSLYDSFAVMVNSDAPVAMASFGGYQFDVPDGGQFDVGSVLFPSNKLNLALLGHEMGHAYFFPHSKAEGVEYRNPWDVMGSTSGYRCSVNADPVYSCLGQHTIAAYKYQAGWISDEQKYDAPIGTNTVILERLAQPQTDNYLMATIATAETTYVLEARQRVGYDTKLVGDAVIIHKVDDLVDPTGSPFDDEGAMWTPGETFVDEANDIEVHIDSATPTGFVITIRNGSEPLLDANLTADPTTPSTGEEVLFTTTLSYTGGDSAETFAMLTATIPPEMTIVPNSTTTTFGTVLSHDPPVVDIDPLGATPVTITYRATVNDDIIDPTLISVPVRVDWGGETSNYEHVLLANGESTFLPMVIR